MPILLVECVTVILILWELLNNHIQFYRNSFQKLKAQIGYIYTKQYCKKHSISQAISVYWLYLVYSSVLLVSIVLLHLCATSSVWHSEQSIMFQKLSQFLSMVKRKDVIYSFWSIGNSQSKSTELGLTI
jgi:hypothetical protein